MRRVGSGFGFVVLVVVLAIVLLLTARAFKATMPAAAGALKPDEGTQEPLPAESASPRAVDADLRKIERQADRRAQEYQDALSTAN